VFEQIYNEAYVPLSNNEITQEEAFDAAIEPLRDFMLKNVDDKDLDAMCGIAGIEEVAGTDDIPTSVLIPSFIISELRIAFFIGFLIYVPFLVIDMVVSSVLMSMGMMMLPPTTISLPFKILLFVLADGWNLIIVNLIETIKV
ncbi:MAG: flagellar type III secretion system pore protein FliP, partial [Lachnospiraceae bacterium]